MDDDLLDRYDDDENLITVNGEEKKVVSIVFLVLISLQVKNNIPTTHTKIRNKIKTILLLLC